MNTFQRKHAKLSHDYFSKRKCHTFHTPQGPVRCEGVATRSPLTLAPAPHRVPLLSVRRGGAVAAPLFPRLCTSANMSRPSFSGTTRATSTGFVGGVSPLRLHAGSCVGFGAALPDADYMTVHPRLERVKHG